VTDEIAWTTAEQDRIATGFGSLPAAYRRGWRDGAGDEWYAGPIRVPADLFVPLVEPVDTTPDIDDREDLVDVLDMHMRLDGRGDAERVADALIGHPGLLHRLSARAVSGAGTAAEPEVVAYLIGQYDRLLALHRAVVMDTAEDRDIHARVVVAAEEAVAPIRARMADAAQEENR
jgi:hypothetical protein